MDMTRRQAALSALLVAGLLVASSLGGPAVAGESCVVRLSITSKLPPCNVPMDPTIDFGKLIRQAGLPGLLDPNSIEVIDAKTGKPVPHALEGFQYGDVGRVEWVIKNSSHTVYEIRFKTAEKRPPLEPAEYTPAIGTGDLLRYNAGVPRPIALIYPIGLFDLTGDGKRDLVGCWNYAYRPGEPWDGIVCYPRVGGDEKFEFGDMVRLRYLQKETSTDFKHFIASSHYMNADLADLNGDGRIDIAFRPWYTRKLFFYLNTGKRDRGGMPVFLAAGNLAVEDWQYGEFRAVDLNRDGAVDFVIRNRYFRNTNPKGWPIRLAKPVGIASGTLACFYDVDGDGALDAVCLSGAEHGLPDVNRVEWRRNLGGDPPTFGPGRALDDIDVFAPSKVAAVPDGPRRGLLVEHDVFQQVSFYQQLPDRNGKPRFRRFGRAESKSAVISLSDQATPYPCDWDGDGDLDLLVGGGYGWPRIVINEGTTARPAYAEAKNIMSEGKPIRILRDDLLASKHPFHNMGYLLPSCVDWNHDGLPDLMIPNETNRIVWYKNIGTRAEPAFGPQQFLVVDGFPDSPERRAESGRLSSDKNVKNYPYPFENTPFFWRTCAGFGDLNGDGLTDLVTLDGTSRRTILYAQYRDAAGKLRLKRERELTVGGKSFRASCTRIVDWDGDGLNDLVVLLGWQGKGQHYLLRNRGTKTDPKFEKFVRLCCFGVPINVCSHGPHAWAGDLDGDTKPDLLTYTEWSVYPFFSHAALTMKRRPGYTLGQARILEE